MDKKNPAGKQRDSLNNIVCHFVGGEICFKFRDFSSACRRIRNNSIVNLFHNQHFVN
jgi:hypothetical protein